MTEYRHFAAALAAAAALVSPALAQVEPQAKAVLEGSAAAISDIKSITYNAHSFGDGAMKGMFDYTGDVRMIRTPAGRARSPQWFKGDGTFSIEGASKFLVSTDGRNVTWTDFSTNTVSIRPLSQRGPGPGELKKAQQLVMDPLLDPSPFSMDLKADKLTLEGVGEVQGEMCQIVKADYENGTRRITWWVSMNDQLPRKVERATGGEQNYVAMILEIWNIDLDANLTPADIAVATPEGFVRDEQVALERNNTPANVPAPAPVKTVVGLPPGTAAPAFTLKATNGKDVSLESLQGKTVVLTFWSTRAGRGKEAVTALQSVAKRFEGKNVELVAVSCREGNDSAAADFFRQNKLSYTLVTGGDDVAKNFAVQGFPTVVVVGPDGKVVETIQGFPGATMLTQKVVTSVDSAMAHGGN